MMTVQTTTAPGIGAIELKRQYQASMVSALVLAALFHLCLVGAVLIWDEASGIPTAPPADAADTFGDVEIRPWHPPPRMDRDLPDQQRGAPPVDFAPGVIPIPTADALVPDQPDIPTKAELASLSESLDLPGIVDYGGLAQDGSRPGSGAGAIYYPEPDEFVPVDRMPVIIKLGQPEYPEVARLTETEGAVWVRALVDINGSVRKAQISESSKTNVGFEEAAVTAAYESKFMPAIQNNHPVAVWVTYKVEFKLAEHQ